MTRRQALLLMQIAPAGQHLSINIRPWPPPFLRIMLGGTNGMSRLEVVGPDGETLTFTPEQIMEALR